MSRGKNIDSMLQPLAPKQIQFYFGTGLHTLGLIGWVLDQIGKADIKVSTFSTSDAFLSGFFNLKKRGLIGKAYLLADLKAAKKTLQLRQIMWRCFDNVYLAQNHSKIVLISNDRMRISVITSQNQTYGDRAECTMITTNDYAYYTLSDGWDKIINKSIDGVFRKIARRDNRVCQELDVTQRDRRNTRT